MRIAVWHNLPSGGGKRALYYHVRGLVERGHKVEVWCPPTADQSYLPLGELVPEHVVPLDWPSEPANAVAKLVGAYRNMARKLRAMDRHCKRCAAQINRGAFDILFANACTFFRVTSITRHVRVPKVLYLQEPYRPLYEPMPRLPWLALPPPKRALELPGYIPYFLYDLLKVQGYRVQAREELRNAQAADMILVNSYFSRESILRAYGLDAKVCYLGVDESLFKPRQTPKGNYIVGIGAFVYEKNIEFVIRALAEVAPPRPRLVWVGNAVISSYLEELKRLACSLGVEFEPKASVTQTELLDTLGGARLMVYAPRLEPFGFAPLEANACGVPVVAVAEGGVRETVSEGVNGLLVEHEPQAMASGIERLLRDEELATRLGRRGRELVTERWSLDAALDRLEGRLRQALASARDSGK